MVAATKLATKGSRRHAPNLRHSIAVPLNRPASPCGMNIITTTNKMPWYSSQD
ncbi:hypothetical protein D3C71_1946160 [compost metagenome]